MKELYRKINEYIKYFTTCCPKAGLTCDFFVRH